jgi:hypothetical protein
MGNIHGIGFLVTHSQLISPKNMEASFFRSERVLFSMRSYQKISMVALGGIAVVLYGCVKPNKDPSPPVESPTATLSEKVAIKCRYGEMGDVINHICWDRCPVGERWNGDGCSSIGYIRETLTYDLATTACHQLGARLPTVEEFESVLGNCREWDPPGEGWRKCNKCEQSEECEKLLGPWFYHQGFGLWASGKEPKRIIIWTGWIRPRYSEADPKEENMWAVCVRDIEPVETTRPGPATTQ